MKRLLVIILIVTAFLGGYHLGHKEGSPDITGWAQKAYPKVVEAGREAIATVRDTPKTADSSQPSTVQGNLYRAAKGAVQRQVNTHPEWDPRSWHVQEQSSSPR